MSDRKQKIIDAAQELLEERGYNGFSYADLEKALGIRKASIHHHFPKKDDLIAAILDKVAVLLQDKKITLAQCGGSAFEKIWQFLGGGCETSACSGRICTITSLQHDFPQLSSELQKKLTELCSFEVEIVAEILEDAKKRKKIEFAGPAIDKARSVLVTAKGAMHYARIYGQPFVESIRKELETGLAKP